MCRSGAAAAAGESRLPRRGHICRVKIKVRLQVRNRTCRPSTKPSMHATWLSAEAHSRTGPTGSRASSGGADWWSGGCHGSSCPSPGRAAKVQATKRRRSSSQGGFGSASQRRQHSSGGTRSGRSTKVLLSSGKILAAWIATRIGPEKGSCIELVVANTDRPTAAARAHTRCAGAGGQKLEFLSGA